MACYHLCQHSWVISLLTAAGILRAYSGQPADNDWAWCIPNSAQWESPAPILIVVICAPESPWWLVRKGCLDNAARALAHLASPGPSIKLDISHADIIAMMVYTNEKEQETVSGTSYLDCFRGVNQRRTEIACVV